LLKRVSLRPLARGDTRTDCGVATGVAGGGLLFRAMDKGIRLSCDIEGSPEGDPGQVVKEDCGGSDVDASAFAELIQERVFCAAAS